MDGRYLSSHEKMICNMIENKYFTRIKQIPLDDVEGRKKKLEEMKDADDREISRRDYSESLKEYMKSVSDNMYALLHNKSTIKEMRNYTSRSFFERYIKIIGGRNNRKYDMQDLADGNLNLSKMDTIDDHSLTLFKDIENKYQTYDGTNISIKNMGKLYLIVDGKKAPIDVEGYIITKTGIDGKSYTDEVYSYIDNERMQRDSEYRDAVLTELLSDKNIKLSNASGYIGEIIDTPEELKGKSKEQTVDTGKGYKNYYYKVNDNYSIYYSGLKLVAARVNEEKERQRSRKKHPVFPSDDEMEIG